MQAVVLAAGSGARLMPLTKVIPKALIPVANKPLLDHTLHALQRAQVKRIIIATGHLGSKIVRHLETSKQYAGVEIRCINADRYKSGPLYSLLATEELIDDDFVLTPADLIFSHRLMVNLVEDHVEKGTLHVAIDEGSPESHEGSSILCFGKAGYSNTSLRFEESQKIGGIDRGTEKQIVGISVGIIICPKEIFKYAHLAEVNGSTRVTDALNKFIADTGRIRHIKLGSKDYWFDVDTIKTLIEANAFILQNSLLDDGNTGKFYHDKTISEVKSKVRGAYLTSPARIIGPTIIGGGCVIGEGSNIGPYVSIQNNCRIGKEVKCRNAIVLSNSKIKEKVSIENSVAFGTRTVGMRKPSDEPTFPTPRV